MCRPGSLRRRPGMAQWTAPQASRRRLQLVRRDMPMATSVRHRRCRGRPVAPSSGFRKRAVIQPGMASPRSAAHGWLVFWTRREPQGTVLHADRQHDPPRAAPENRPRWPRARMRSASRQTAWRMAATARSGAPTDCLRRLRPGQSAASASERRHRSSRPLWRRPLRCSMRPPRCQGAELSASAQDPLRPGSAPSDRALPPMAAAQSQGEPRQPLAGRSRYPRCRPSAPRHVTPAGVQMHPSEGSRKRRNRTEWSMTARCDRRAVLYPAILASAA